MLTLMRANGGSYTVHHTREEHSGVFETAQALKEDFKTTLFFSSARRQLRGCRCHRFAAAARVTMRRKCGEEPDKTRAICGNLDQSSVERGTQNKKHTSASASAFGESRDATQHNATLAFITSCTTRATSRSIRVAGGASREGRARNSGGGDDACSRMMLAVFEVHAKPCAEAPPRSRASRRKRRARSRRRWRRRVRRWRGAKSPKTTPMSREAQRSIARRDRHRHTPPPRRCAGVVVRIAHCAAAQKKEEAQGRFELLHHAAYRGARLFRGDDSRRRRCRHHSSSSSSFAFAPVSSARESPAVTNAADAIRGDVAATLHRRLDRWSSPSYAGACAWWGAARCDEHRVTHTYSRTYSFLYVGFYTVYAADDD